ncbi:hypothetical protein D9757_006622 [Collybiopsis confluens]|uniref:Protein kinase domain-containing protein n=1 Tax=Collybiopsis confluens TaxID=2823264 RepID=A0A8H5MB89_9AGAR|nr:hypothetical protein D9757_015460 [Collybiopsis confluens]KAF5387534.1 hypothetical protein D9757_006622 [Collybiopsis confluens]
MNSPLITMPPKQAKAAATAQIHNGSYNFILEISGKLVTFETISKTSVADTDKVFSIALSKVIIPLLQKHDSRVREPEAKILTKVFRITSDVFDGLGLQLGQRTTLNLDGGERFQLRLLDSLKDYMLVDPTDGRLDPVANPPTEALFTKEPTLALISHSLPPDESHYLYPTFIKSQAPSGFLHKDLKLNDIFQYDEYVAQHPGLISEQPAHVRQLWDKWSGKRPLTEKACDRLCKKLRKRGYATAFITETFSQATGSGGVNDPQSLVREKEEIEHYAHIITQETLAGPFSELSPKLGLERMAEFYFFGRFSIFLKAYAPIFSIFDKNHPMPISPLVLRTDAKGAKTFTPYAAKSDVGIWLRLAPWPMLLVELQSGNKLNLELSDDYVRMMLQGGSLVKTMNIAQGMDGTSKPTATLPMLYITKDWTVANMYLMFALEKKVFVLERRYNLAESLHQRIKFTRDLYNLLDCMMDTIPSEALLKHMSAAGTELLDIVELGTRLEGDGNSKRKADQAPEGEGSRAKRSQTGGDQKQNSLEMEANLPGFQFEAIRTDVLYRGRSPDGDPIVAKRVLTESNERNFHLKLRDIRNSTDYVLPLLQEFTIPSSADRYIHLVFPRWIPLTSLMEVSPTSSELVEMCSALAAAISFLHENMIAHLDIKPANLVVQRSIFGTLQIRIIDFSISVSVANAEERISSRSGTPRYMAPEVMEQVDYRPFKADLYSFGQVLLRLSWYMDQDDGLKVLHWARSLTHKEPEMRPQLSSLPSLLPENLTFYKYSPTLVTAQLDFGGSISVLSSAALPVFTLPVFTM